MSRLTLFEQSVLKNRSVSSFDTTKAEWSGGTEMVAIYDLDAESILRMAQVDLAGLNAEPESPIGSFSFHGCTGGIGAFKGRPPWEFHGGGDELLFVLAGESELTVLEGNNREVQTLVPGQLAIVPRSRWHSNDAPTGVTMLFITPNEGNEHSWDQPSL